MTDSKELPPSDQFLLLVRLHRKAVFSLAYSKVRNVQDAEDITQEVFAEAYQNLVKLRNHTNALAWLMKATGFRCKDHMRKMLRRQRRETSYIEMISLSKDRFFARPQDNKYDVEHGEKPSDGLLDVVASLPEKFRVVLMLKHFAQLSYDDISRMTGLSKTTIDGRLRTAKKKLKAKLERRLRG